MQALPVNKCSFTTMSQNVLRIKSYLADFDESCRQIWNKNIEVQDKHIWQEDIKQTTEFQISVKENEQTLYHGIRCHITVTKCVECVVK